jgi:hypothetical protein
LKSDLYINLVFEDDLSGAVLQRLVAQVRPDCVIGLSYRTGGKGNIKRKLKGFNHAAKGMPYLVLVDLDDEYECPPTLLKDWFGYERHSNLYFRVAVREVESWLLASRSAFSNYLSIPQDEIPQNTDEIENPKDFLLTLAKKSRKKTIRDDLVPRMGITAKVGPNYNAQLAGFVNQIWDYKEALRFSLSLKRMVECLKKM